MPELALIGLGSNLGDRLALLDAAVASLRETPGITIRAVSSFHETTPVGGPIGQGAFLNAAAALETTIEPRSLLDRLNAIEQEANRVRTVRWGERTLDLDLLLYGDRMIETPRLTLPHPRMAFRRFVLAPMVEIAPETVDPRTRRTVLDLLRNLDRRPSHVAIACPLRVDFRLLNKPPVRIDSRRLVELWKSIETEEVHLQKRLCEDLPATAVEDRMNYEEMEQLADSLLSQRKPESFDERESTLKEWMISLSSLGWEDRPSRALTPANHWLVSHFWFDAQFLTYDSLKTSIPDFQRFRKEFLEGRSRALSPTFVVVRSVDTECMGARDHRLDWQWPISRDTPLLEVKDFDSDETFQEVLATCAATRSG